MSGGSYDYAYHFVRDMAEEILVREKTFELRRAFARHMLDVADAMHAIEWVDSGDFSPGDEVAAIEKALRKEP